MTMTIERRAALALAGVLLVLALAVPAWQAFASHRAARYQILTGDVVSGLIAGAPVEFHGVEVGQVKLVQLLDPRTVRIVVELDRAAPVTTATVATVTGRGLAARGFTGYVFVSLEDTRAATAPLAPAGEGELPQIAAAPSQTTSLDTTMGELARSVQSVNGLLQAALDPQAIGALRQSAVSLGQVTQALAANTGRLEAILARTEDASRQLPALVRTGTEVATSLRTQVLPRTLDTLANVDRAARSAGERMDEIARSTQEASGRAEPLLASSQEVARSLRDDILPQTDRSLRRLERLTDTLDEVARGIRDNPSALLRGPESPPPGPGEAE